MVARNPVPGPLSVPGVSLQVRRKFSEVRAASLVPCRGRERKRRGKPRSAAFPSLVDPVLSTALVIYQFLRPKPQANLLLRALHGIAAMDDVPGQGKRWPRYQDHRVKTAQKRPPFPLPESPPLQESQSSRH